MSDEFDYNASAVTSYFVLNSRHNIHISRLYIRQSIYSRCPKWEREWVGMGMIRWEFEGNGNKKVIPAHLYRQGQVVEVNVA